MEKDVLNALETLDGVTSEHFEGHHNGVLHDFRVVFEVEDVDCAVVGGGGHEGVFLVEVDGGYGFLVELHGLVGFGGQVDVVAD